MYTFMKVVGVGGVERTTHCREADKAGRGPVTAQHLIQPLALRRCLTHPQWVLLCPHPQGW